MSKLTKRYTNKLKRLYTHFVGYKVGTFYKRRYMYLDEFVAMLKKLAIIDQRFTKREARMAFWYMHSSPPCEADAMADPLSHTATTTTTTHTPQLEPYSYR